MRNRSHPCLTIFLALFEFVVEFHNNNKNKNKNKKCSTVTENFCTVAVATHGDGDDVYINES